MLRYTLYSEGNIDYNLNTYISVDPWHIYSICMNCRQHAIHILYQVFETFRTVKTNCINLYEISKSSYVQYSISTVYNSPVVLTHCTYGDYLYKFVCIADVCNDVLIFYSSQRKV